MSALHAWLERILKIPPVPSPPEGSSGSTRVFRAATPFYWYLLIRWGLAQLSGAIGIGFGLAFITRIPEGSWSVWVQLAEVIGIVTFVVQIPVTFLALSLDYRLRWYLVSDRSLRIREGVFRVREQTMSFANIQNLSIRQNPLHQLLGIFDVEVHTAGGGGPTIDDGTSTRNPHHGVFRGVDNAVELRQLILDHQRKLRDAGLGDADDDCALAKETVRAETLQELSSLARTVEEAARALRHV